jgi:hypothetical protein
MAQPLLTTTPGLDTRKASFGNANGITELSEDPIAIAEHLIQEHGLDRAVEKATEGISASQRDGDNYQLSVWREIKGILVNRREEGLI